jgi:hypothetical protein
VAAYVKQLTTISTQLENTREASGIRASEIVKAIKEVCDDLAATEGSKLGE